MDYILSGHGTLNNSERLARQLIDVAAIRVKLTSLSEWSQLSPKKVYFFRNR